MLNVVVDVETDGPYPPRYSMVSFGAVILEEGLGRTFYGKVRPISAHWNPAALAVSGHTREETLLFPEAAIVLPDFVRWLHANNTAHKQSMFWSDNNGFDWLFMNHYLWEYAGGNPFGHTSRNIQDLYRGMRRTMRANIRHLRKTPHSHCPVDDARGNGEALLAMVRMGLDIRL